KPEQLHTASKPEQLHTANKPEQLYTANKPEQLYTANIPKQLHTANIPKQLHMANKPKQLHTASKPKQLYTANIPKQLHMANKPKQLHTANKPEQLHTANKPEQLYTANIPKQLHTANKPKQLHTANIPKQLHMANKPKQLHTANKPEQLYTTSKPKQLHTANKPKQLHTANKPKQLHTANKPKQLYTANKPKQLHRANKPKQLHTANKPKQLHTANKPEQLHTASKPKQLHTAKKPKQLYTTNKPKQLHTANKPKQLHTANKPKQLYTANKPKQLHTANKPKQLHTANKPKQLHTASKPVSNGCGNDVWVHCPSFPVHWVELGGVHSLHSAHRFRQETTNSESKTMAHILFSQSPNIYYPDDHKASLLRLSIFIIAGGCGGVPALVWTLRVIWRKYEGRISAVVIMLLLSDLLELLLSPYVVTKLLQNDHCWETSTMCRFLTSLWSALLFNGLYLQQVMVLEGALTLRHPTCSAHAFSPFCSIIISIFMFLYFLLLHSAGGLRWQFTALQLVGSFDPIYQDANQDGLIRLSIFIIVGVCGGLPALVWALRVLCHKGGGRISAFIIMLLLSDLLELLLSPYVVTKLLQDDHCWDSMHSAGGLRSQFTALQLVGSFGQRTTHSVTTSTMAHILFSQPPYPGAQQEYPAGKIRLSIFLIAGVSGGLPAIVWALRLLYRHHKSGGRTSALIIMLLLSDLLVLLLSPYVNSTTYGQHPLQNQEPELYGVSSCHFHHHYVHILFSVALRRSMGGGCFSDEFESDDGPPAVSVDLQKGRQPLRRLPSTPRHRRLQWCRARLSWSDSEWQPVIFSDESRFCPGGDDRRIPVWRPRAYQQHPTGTQHVTGLYIKLLSYCDYYMTSIPEYQHPEHNTYWSYW
ncbi:hypothetical protein NFI96_004450, partial [Prochilodus magdalenae]